MKYKGWAVFMDSDMIFRSDIKKLFTLFDDQYAAMVVKHQHIPLPNERKMDGREQLRYHRKNWSSLIAYNCGHPSNVRLTPEWVNFAKGSDLHSLSWLKDHEIGSLPFTYNYISGVSPKLPPENERNPDLIHFTEGGPWFAECQEVPFAQLWVDEHEDWSANGHDIISPVASTVHEK
jgi:lipopolysaccharide biosynthesis glycosyltransferase